MSRILYKYLDIDGAKCMIKNHNLQFTNATQLNDPFECHQKLIDYSKVVLSENSKEPTREIFAKKLRDNTWLCSLSEINDSILMWAHYCKNHKGVCIGLDIYNVKECFHLTPQNKYFEPGLTVVQYKEIIDCPTGDDIMDMVKYQWKTKAKAWEYEKEVRFVFPYPYMLPSCLERANYNTEREDKGGGRKAHYYATLKPECFDSIYLGVNTDEAEKEWIIKYARKMNPQIKLYQMKVDANAFRLNPEVIKPLNSDLSHD